MTLSEQAFIRLKDLYWAEKATVHPDDYELKGLGYVKIESGATCITTEGRVAFEVKKAL